MHEPTPPAQCWLRRTGGSAAVRPGRAALSGARRAAPGAGAPAAAHHGAATRTAGARRHPRRRRTAGRAGDTGPLTSAARRPWSTAVPRHGTPRTDPGRTPKAGRGTTTRHRTEGAVSHAHHRSRAPRGTRGARRHIGPPVAHPLATDRFPFRPPHIFSQLPGHGTPVPKRPPNRRSTRAKRVRTDLGALRGLATGARRASPPPPASRPFVIECFTPSCHVDIPALVQLGFPATPDTVDSILTVVRPAGDFVRDRGETCWSERPVQ